MIARTSIVGLIMAAATGCSSKITVDSISSPAGACNPGNASSAPCDTQPSTSPDHTPSFAITGRSPVVVGPGDQVVMSGRGFGKAMTLSVQGYGIQAPLVMDLKVQSDTQATATMPQSAAFGELALTASQGATTQQISVFFAAGKLDHPLFTADASQICRGVQFYDGGGSLRDGTRNCVPPGPDAAPVCSADGQVGCVTSAMYPATATQGLAAKVLAGKSVAGVGGVATGGQLACSSDGGANCVVDGLTYRAAKLSNFTGANITSGTAIAGVPGSLSNCSMDGTTGCVAVAGFKAADMSAAAAGNIKSGITIAGVVGGYPSAAAKLPSAGGHAGLTSLAASIAAGTYEWWDAAGTYHSGTIADAGTVMPTASSQSFTTSVFRQFFVAGDPNLATANIKNGVSIFGVTGLYPSASYPLPGASAADLDAATFTSKIKSATTFEWWDQTGTRYSGAGDPNIASSNIASTVSIFGTSGSLGTSCSLCNGDGQTACQTTARYKSVDTAALSVWDVRAGKSAGGLAGSMTFYKNMADTLKFDRTNGTGAVIGLDIYDTIDDADTNGLPTQNPGHWEQATGANWVRDPLSDNGAGGGTAANGQCDGTEICVFQDLNSGLYWAPSDGTPRDWEGAITYCDSLNGVNYGGYASGWRLPTQKEQMQAYIDGIEDVANKNVAFILPNTPQWSSTSSSSASGSAWVLNPAGGQTNLTAKSIGRYEACVRP